MIFFVRGWVEEVFLYAERSVLSGSSRRRYSFCVYIEFGEFFYLLLVRSGDRLRIVFFG